MFYIFISKQMQEYLQEEGKMTILILITISRDILSKLN